MAISEALAKTRLRKRWKEQVDRYPNMANEISLETYIYANLHRVMQQDLLAYCDRLPNWHPSK